MPSDGSGYVKLWGRNLIEWAELRPLAILHIAKRNLKLIPHLHPSDVDYLRSTLKRALENAGYSYLRMIHDDHNLFRILARVDHTRDSCYHQQARKALYDHYLTH